MDVHDWLRKTIDEDPIGLPSRQIYVESGEHVWHDMHFVHAALHEQGISRDKKWWLRDCHRYWERAAVSDTHFHIKKAECGAADVSSVCDSFALYMLLWINIVCARTSEVVRTCASFLRQACVRTQETLCGDVPLLLVSLVFRNGQASLHLRRGRKISGLREAATHLHPAAAECLSRTWYNMCSGGVLHEPFEQDEHELTDVVHFAAFFCKEQRSCRKFVGKSIHKLLNQLRDALVSVLAVRMDRYILDVYLPAHRQNKPAPAVVPPEKSGTRKYVQVQPATVWSLIGNSRKAGSSLAGVVRCRSDDAHVGCSESQSELWMAKRQHLYRQRRSLCFHGARHLNMVADPSTHSKRETMVTVCWSWEAAAATHGDVQVLPATSALLPSEQELPSHVAELAAQLRLERVSAFRQLQALSHTIQGLANSQWKGLGDFGLPEDFRIHAVEQNHVRVLRQGPLVDTACVVDMGTRHCTPVLPESALAPTQDGLMVPDSDLAPMHRVNLLVLGLDQGSVGSAGAAFLDHIGAMVHTKWDKFHRCIRDIKLGMSYDNVFLKTQLYTSYLWGINYKPFGTGLFGTQKNTC